MPEAFQEYQLNKNQLFMLLDLGGTIAAMACDVTYDQTDVEPRTRTLGNIQCAFTEFELATLTSGQARMLLAKIFRIALHCVDPMAVPNLATPDQFRNALIEYLDTHDRHGCKRTPAGEVCWNERTNVLGFLAHCCGINTPERLAMFSQQLDAYNKLCEDPSCPEKKLALMVQLRDARDRYGVDAVELCESGMIRVWCKPGVRYSRDVAPSSEVMMHFRLAGKPIDFELLSANEGYPPACQVYKPGDDEKFSSGISYGEGGIYYSDGTAERRGGYYFYPHFPPAEKGRVDII